LLGPLAGSVLASSARRPVIAVGWQLRWLIIRSLDSVAVASVRTISVSYPVVTVTGPVSSITIGGQLRGTLLRFPCRATTIPVAGTVSVPDVITITVSDIDIVTVINVDVVSTATVMAAMPAVVVVIDAVVMPIQFVVNPGSHRQTKSKRDKRCDYVCRLLDVHGFRRILWNVDNLRIGGHDLDHFLFNHDGLLRSFFQISGLLRFCPQPLHRIKNIFRLGDECFPQVRGPIQFGIHHFKNVRIMSQGLDAFFPRLSIDFGCVFPRGNIPSRHDDIAGFR